MLILQNISLCGLFFSIRCFIGRCYSLIKLKCWFRLQSHMFLLNVRWFIGNIALKLLAFGKIPLFEEPSTWKRRSTGIDSKCWSCKGFSWYAVHVRHLRKDISKESKPEILQKGTIKKMKKKYAQIVEKNLPTSLHSTHIEKTSIQRISNKEFEEEINEASNQLC